MSDTPRPITLLDVVRVADEATTEHPKRKNPWRLDTAGHVSCLYTDTQDPTLHCLGGEILLRLGCELPPEGNSVAVTPDRLRFVGYYDEYDQGAAMKFLAYLQGEADGGMTDDGGVGWGDYRMEWREAFESARNCYRSVIDAAEDRRRDAPR